MLKESPRCGRSASDFLRDPPDGPVSLGRVCYTVNPEERNVKELGILTALGDGNLERGVYVNMGPRGGS